MKIESQDKRIDELLKGNIFLIPRFQREYSWEPDHVSEFWDDIMDNMTEPYFIGAMVVYKIERSTLAVVDGQQRLTTITILLCAMREAFKKLGRPELANGLQAYIEQKDRENRTVYVLKTESSFPFLQEEILKSEDAEVPFEIGREEEAIQKAYNIFKEKIDQNLSEYLSNKEQTAEDNSKDAADWLSMLRDTVFDLNLILVTLDSEDDAYLIFETLNTRGKDLALADLLRNHFAKLIKAASEVDQVKQKWSKVQDTIKSSPVQLDPDTFIVHSWQSRYDFATKAKVFHKVKDTVNKKNAKSHLDRFVSDAEQWRSIFDTDYLWSKAEKEASRSLAALRTFKVVQPAPGILSLVRAYRDKQIKYRALRNALSNIEKFHFSFNAVTSSRSSGGISGMYSSFGRSIFEADDSSIAAQAIADLVGKLRDREVPAVEFDAGFQQVIYTNKHSSQKSLVQYILKKVAIHEGQPFRGDTEDLTIEHLLPQSSSKNDRDHETIGQIGNLVLVDAKTNEKLSTKNFKEKKLF
ncbi:DUF262 domain-containing protein [Pseudosulfitobacter pseudonitzschiae]|uniref:DUF262 domain-containing protein n=1 Tax=Pseudosulfitobacter pseudonitzschiae TaxID=1402135 RepID=UPI001AF695F5|nr:DUF262 domain-containing protein [Pseudosulfitobacter pseudonitzschiae]MBM1814953.1 DUF262 domain-containing protein [Pseudosulfitobacter pseudonitzschiae]MBM1831944.1 DUF262 domain-containing protein [Pseudosulfitobacter pseudonitzschiae]MBM1836812.1 DUF262 domain-containing protein [Pseudosulfitobacter pseudonitzschiae]MBM1841658.1 DUF262 domain-containing protein [Pseudosulfitobacter pseudonitzschiae]MBM1846526.1 DUF262 domain-containing protein [Pseudosulfitobacter pseudonitzschiae]